MTSTSLRDRARAAALAQEEQARIDREARLASHRAERIATLHRHLAGLLGDDAPTGAAIMRQNPPASERFEATWRNEDGLTFVLVPDGGSNGNSVLHAGFFCPICGKGLQGRASSGGYARWATSHVYNLAALGRIYAEGEKPTHYGRTLLDTATNGCHQCDERLAAKEAAEEAELAAQRAPQAQQALDPADRDAADYPTDLDEDKRFKSPHDDWVVIHQPFEDESGGCVNPLTYYGLTVERLADLHGVSVLTVCRWIAKWVEPGMK